MENEAHQLVGERREVYDRWGAQCNECAELVAGVFQRTCETGQVLEEEIDTLFKKDAAASFCERILAEYKETQFMRADVPRVDGKHLNVSLEDEFKRLSERVSCLETALVQMTKRYESATNLA